MTERRKRGKGYPKGYIERRIAILVFDYSGGIEEPEIRDWLKENYNIREKKGIRSHLEKLKEKEFLILEPQRGEDNIWKPCPETKLEILSYVCEGMQWDTKEEVVSALFTGYVQRAIDELLLPIFGKQCGVLDGYFENGEFVCLTELERQEPEKRTLKIKERPEEGVIMSLPEEGVILPELEPDIWNFLKKGFKLSPTALSHILNELPEVKIAAALMLTAQPNYVDRGVDTRSIAVATLCSCLLIDKAKYPLLKDKIGDFFRDPDIARTLTTWLGWDFLHQRLEDWIERMYKVGEVFR